MEIVYDILLSLTITHPHFLVKEPEDDAAKNEGEEPGLDEPIGNAEAPLIDNGTTITGEDDVPKGYKASFEDFEMMPDKKTQALINEFRMLQKKINNTWYLFFQKEGPFKPAESEFENREFMFELKINNTHFFSVTSEDYLNEKNKMLWFDKAIDTLKIPEKRKVQPLKFKYSIYKPLRPVTIKVATLTGAVIISQTVTEANIKDTDVDLFKEGESIYDITENNVQPDPSDDGKIFAKETIGPDAFYGMVYFKVKPPNNGAGNNKFTIDMKRAKPQEESNN